MFCTQTGGLLIPGNVSRQLIHVLKRMGLPRIRFLDPRHTTATLLLSARVNLKVVSEMLSHASTTITLDIYSHVLPDMQQDAAEAMGHLLFPVHVENAQSESTLMPTPQVSQIHSKNCSQI
ncbi:MAG TPA: tyrosine-type recombinase/integrase [Ktedonobacterales bacterium]